MNNIIRTTVHDFEGFTYVEHEGQFFKGCQRCHGTGHYSYNGSDSDCYLCGNTAAKLGEPLDNEAAAQKWCHGKALARQRREAAKEQARLLEVAKLAEKVASIPEDVREFLLNVELNEYDTEADYYSENKNANYEKDSFLRAMAEQLQFVTNARRPFTDKMVASVRASLERRTAKQAEAATHPVPAGREVVTGEIIAVKTVEGDYGTAYKMTVKDDRGFRVYCSIPKAQSDELAFGEDYDPEHGWLQAAKGRRITFTATLTPSNDDTAFGFGSRPTKGAWL